MSGQIAEFWASLGFKVDPAELKKVDKFLGDAEKRLKRNSKKKTEESKATDRVTKAVKGEVAAKVASAKADVAATKAINQKASATRRLTAAEKEAQRVGARLRSTPFMDTAVQQRINSMFPAMAGGVLGARSQDRRLLTSFYRGAFDSAAKGRVGIRNPAAFEIKALGVTALSLSLLKALLSETTPLLLALSMLSSDLRPSFLSLASSLAAWRASLLCLL